MNALKWFGEQLVNPLVEDAGAEKKIAIEKGKAETVKTRCGVENTFIDEKLAHEAEIRKSIVDLMRTKMAEIAGRVETGPDTGDNKSLREYEEAVWELLSLCRMSMEAADLDWVERRNREFEESMSNY